MYVFRESRDMQNFDNVFFPNFPIIHIKMTLLSFQVLF